uniref:acetate--CoA ligase n=1 Tax=Parascaris univalens TaxID=6257 RepID=A0A914ZV26_PARUN
MSNSTMNMVHFIEEIFAMMCNYRCYDLKTAPMVICGNKGSAYCGQFANIMKKMDSIDELSFKCVERWTNKYSKSDYRLFWEGNYYDSDVHDCAELTSETLEVLVRKCVNVLAENGVTSNTQLALYLPALIQMPIAALAAIRIGAAFLPISAMEESVDELSALLKHSSCEVIVSVDGFWSGKRLIRTKEILDDAIANEENRYRRVLLVRHVTPNEGVPPPQKHILARRPYYLYKVNMKEGRDVWWSKLFACATTECKVVTVDEGDAAVLQAVRNQQSLSLVKRSRADLRKEIENLEQHIDASGVCFVMCTNDAYIAIVAMLAVLHSSAQLLIFEGIVSYPDFSRISQIINKYEVKTMIISETDLNLVLDNEMYARMWNTATLTKIIIVGEDTVVAARASTIFGVPCETIAPPFQ